MTPAPSCPRCRESGRDTEVETTIEHYGTETFITATCPLCGWTARYAV